MSLLDRQYLFDRLGDSAIDALVSGRVYPDILPQNPTYPAITYLRVGTAHYNALTGTPTLENPQFQVDCWAETHTAAWNLAEAVTSVMLGSTVNFRAQVVNTQQFTETVQSLKLYRIMIEFSIFAAV